jgi:hypothetical protein
MFIVTPEQLAEGAYVLVEGAAYAGIAKDPTVLPGMIALGAAFLGNSAGTSTPQSIATAFQTILSELGVVISPEQSFILGLLDGVNTQFSASLNKTAPSLTVGIASTILTTAGNAINAACALYAKNNTQPAAVKA